MGTLFAIKCTTEFPQINKLVINMTYGSIAENIWTWNFIKSTKARAIKEGYTLKSLDKKLEPISPIPNAPKLKGKRVLLYLSKNDKVLLYEQSLQFKRALDKAGVDYVYVENKHFGHIISGYNNFRKYKVWLDFLLKP
jgi:dipeptidyl aminopeptidase/acylaminoacyl peptidase